MNLQSILDLVNFVSDKEQQGKALTEDTYNTLLPSVNWEMFTFGMTEIVKDGLTPISGELISVSMLNPFKKTGQLSPVNGSVNLPGDYVRFLSFGQYGYNTGEVTVDSQYREITPVSPDQFMRTQNNVYARPDIHPVLKILGTTVYFIPNDIPLVNLDYLRTPKVPFYDYCQNEIGDAIYMPVDSYINSIDDVNYLYDSNRNQLASNVTKDDMNVLPCTAKTVELEWEERFYNDFILRILSKVGINLSADNLTKYAEQKLNENGN